MTRRLGWCALALLSASLMGCESERALDTLVSPSARELTVIDSDLRAVRLGAGYQTLLHSSFQCASDRVSTLYINEADGRARTLIFAQSNASLPAVAGTMGAEMMSAIFRAGGSGRGLSRYERERLVLEMPLAMDIGERIMGNARNAGGMNARGINAPGQLERASALLLDTASAEEAEHDGESLIDPSFLESLAADDAPSLFEELRAEAAPTFGQSAAQLAAQLGLRPIADRTEGLGLGFRRIDGSFAGWAWLRFHHTDDTPAYRFARQEGEWTVRAGQEELDLGAFHIMGHLGPDDDELQLIILCEATTDCLDAQAIFTALRSAKRNTTQRRAPPSSTCADGSVAALASRYGFTLSER